LKLFGSQLSILEKAIDWLFIILGLVMAIAGTVASFY
jgi:hypothetical protein